MMCGLPTKERSMCKILGSALVALALAFASCDGNPFGNLEAEYSGQDAIESPQPGVDSVTPEPEPDTSSPPVFVCEDKDNDNFCANSIQESDQDCNDDVSAIHPNATEVCDNVDQNCNEDANVNPNATEICNFYDTVDDDCDGLVDDEDDSVNPDTYYLSFGDDDGDGFGDPDKTDYACKNPYGNVVNNGDCDDLKANVNTGEDEVCDKLDNDCDGETDEGVKIAFYLDDDGDGFGDSSEVSVGCGVEEGYVLDKTDCDDSESHSYPGGGEICDGEDNDCDGETDEVAASENLCDDGNKLTFDTCELDIGECEYEDVMFLFICQLPEELWNEPGFACGSGVFFDDEEGYGDVIMVEQGVLTIPATDVCAELAVGHTMYVNSYVVQEEVDLAFIWIGGEYVDVSETLTNKTLIGTPGNITILFPGLDFNYVLSDMEICQ